MEFEKTLVIGANGGIGTRVVAAMQDARPGSVRAMARPGRVGEALSSSGAQIVEADLADAFEHALEGVDAVVFAAGSGGSTGLDATLMVDLWGAIRAIAACESRGIRRFVMVSSVGADDPRRGPESLRPYLAAKGAADQVLMRSELDWTVLRPGRLTDEDPAGHVRFAADESVPSISRADVADAVRAVLPAEGWVRRVETLFGGGSSNVATAMLGEAPRSR